MIKKHIFTYQKNKHEIKIHFRTRAYYSLIVF